MERSDTRYPLLIVHQFMWATAQELTFVLIIKNLHFSFFQHEITSSPTLTGTKPDFGIGNAYVCG